MATYPTVRIPNPDRRVPLCEKVSIQKRKGRTKRRFRILERDNYTCQHCNEEYPESYLEVDHTIPLSQGGPDNDSNLKVMCLRCHAEKSATEKEGRSLK